LFNYKGFKDDAIQIFRTSQSLISRENIKLDDREVAPSVANWLRSFIKEKGSDIFNDITLAQYLDRSDNASNLNVIEKKLLRSLLVFYKNINFFPDSMANDLPENWQIFPFNNGNEDNLKMEKTNIIDDKIIEDVIVKKDDKVLHKNEKKEKDSTLENKNVNHAKIESKVSNEKILNSEENLDKENIFKLKQSLKEYKVISLEYKAINSEIKRLENNKVNKK
jgi:hypothetical protein